MSADKQLAREGLTSVLSCLTETYGELPVPNAARSSEQITHVLSQVGSEYPSESAVPCPVRYDVVAAVQANHLV